MLKLQQNEYIVKAVHHHWIAFLGPALLAFVLFIIPFIALPFISNSSHSDIIYPLFYFMWVVWNLMALLVLLASWVDYYLDAIVITNTRIIKINQIGAYRHEVSEFKLERVQDVTIEVPHFVATMLGYGNITIQTAGEINFSIYEIPHINETKDLILKLSKKGNM